MYMGVIWFIYHALQVMLIQVKQQNSGSQIYDEAYAKKWIEDHTFV